MASSVVAAPLTLTLACNVHEIAHAVTGTLLGWRVARLNLCLFSGGGVEYASSTTRGDNLESAAGGVGAALILGLAWWLVVGRSADRHQPLRWGVGAALAAWIGPQLLVAVLETAAPVGEAYGARIEDRPVTFAGILAVTVLSSVGGHAWLWRRSRRGSPASTLVD